MATNNVSPKKGKVVDIPTAPTIGTATAATESATVEYTAATIGGPATTFTALSNPGSFTGTGTSPITVSGLTGGTAYTFTVRGSNATGSGEYSAASNSVTPIAGPTTGMYLWFDAADAATITTSGGYVSQWSDKSGNGLHVTGPATNASGAPVTGTNTRNSKNVITFTQNGTNAAYGGLTNGSTSFLADPTLDVWIVRKHTPGSITSGCALGIGNDQAGSDKVHYQFYDNASNKLKSGANGGFVLSTATQNGTWNITRFTKSGASQELFLGATSQGTSSYNYNLPSSRLQVGALPQAGATNSGVYLMNGDIAEILVYKSVLSGADYTKTYNYLAAKWGF
jgi:hypothetical protein